MPQLLSGLTEQPRTKWLLFFLVVLAAAFAIDFSGTGLSALIMPLTGFGPGDAANATDRLLLAIMLAAFVTADIFVILRLPFVVQIGVVWAQLLILFLAFFYSFDLSFPFIAARRPILIFTGAFTTIYVSLISIGIACVIAMSAALARLSNNGPAYGIATFYISFFRGTPLLLQVYLIYLGLPQIGVTLEAVPSGIIALSLCYGAYMAEIFRAGIQGVPDGQAEAGTALGLRRGLVMRKIVLPQAMKPATSASPC